MIEEHRIPESGDPLTSADIEMILDAVRKRSENFPAESPVMTLTLVLLNIGDRFTPVSCIEQEWEGIKRDIPPGEGIPKCPNGHPLVQETSLHLGWINADVRD